MRETKPSALFAALLWLPKQFAALNARAERIAGKLPEAVVLCLFCVLKGLMGLVHEPWFDEAVAWQIAREASLRDILLTVPHYEGHPPLWHLVLLPFAKLGAPYELSLVLISLLFMGLAVFLLLWYAPFPRLVKWVLPFTYFCFYQYAVISRPYCLMELAFVLCALSHEKRNKKPLFYVLSLAFLCLTSAFGIAIAGGLALAWVIEILREKPLSETVKGLFKDRRVWWLLALLALAVTLILEITPREDTFATLIKSQTEQGSPVVEFFYLLLCLPTDVFFVDFCGYSVSFSSQMDVASLMAPAIIGLVFWGLLGASAYRKKSLCTLVIPVLCFALLGSFAYFNAHHSGILFWFVLFFLWTALNAPNKRKSGAFFSRCAIPLFTVLTAFSLCLSLYWNVASCLVDCKKEYAPSRAMAAFLKEHHMDEARVMVGWKIVEEFSDINLTEAASLMPYFDDNIFFNFMDGDDHQNYITHRVATEEETEQAFATWREDGLPDVLIFDPAAGEVYGDAFNLRDYAVVYHTVSGKIWKGTPLMDSASILVRRDKLSEWGLRELTTQEILAIDRNE